PATPPALAAVCRKAMARNPDARFPSAEALAAEIQRWLADEPVAAYREHWPARAARWARRHRTPVVGAAAPTPAAPARTRPLAPAGARPGRAAPRTLAGPPRPRGPPPPPAGGRGGRRAAAGDARFVNRRRVGSAGAAPPRRTPAAINEAAVAVSSRAAAPTT